MFCHVLLRPNYTKSWKLANQGFCEEALVTREQSGGLQMMSARGLSGTAAN